MKKFRIIYEFYPFQVGRYPYEHEDIEADTLDNAIYILRKKYGDKIEIFKNQSKQI